MEPDPLGPLLKLPVGPSRACPYLPGRTASETAFHAPDLDPELYHELMDRGFRRSGTVFYRPACAGCRECVPIRVPTAGWAPSKSQRRVARRNADLELRVAVPEYTEEKAALYAKYLRGQHEREGPEAAEGLREFLYNSPVASLEFEYRAGGRVVGVGICDVCSRSLSSVYFFFDPDESRRGLGTYSGLCEIAWAAGRGIPYYYLGFYVRDCAGMNYKSRFRPCELMGPDGKWRRFEAPAPDSD